MAEVQVFLEFTSALIPERTLNFIVDPRDMFLSILKEFPDQGQIHAAWMGLTRRLGLAQENLVKYETQYKGPIEGESLELHMSPISTDIGIHGMRGGLQKFQVDSMDWGMDSILFPDGFHTFSRWIPYFFQMDSILLPYGV